jgi:arylsulfatase A-like enzyme
MLAASLLVLLALSQSHPPPRANGTPKRWNFLLIVIDTLRYDATSLAGTSNTPFLQSVARRGVSYSRAFSPHDSTLPSHFTLLTGFRDGLLSALDRPDLALPYQLAQIGYSTFGLSANGTLSPATMATVRGFRDYSCLLDEWQALKPADRDAELKRLDSKLNRYGSRLNEFNRGREFCSGDEVLARLPGMLASGAEPFFGFVNVLEPHDPYLPSDWALGRESESDRSVDPDLRFRKLRFPLVHPEDVTPESRRLSILARINNAEGRSWSLSDDLSNAELTTYRRRYLAQVRDADLVLRKIVLTLENRKLLDNTWVVVTADHGEAFGEGGFLTHMLSDAGDREATRHVPLVWSGPTRIGTSLVVPEVVSLADVAPTIYDMVGIDWRVIAAQSKDVSFGRSLVHQLTTALTPDRRSVPRFSDDMPPSLRESLRKEAIERLRALGYIK